MELNQPSQLFRQLKDIINQAENLKHSSNFEVDAENFSKYNEEIKKFLAQQVSNPMVQERIVKIPKVNYKRVQHKIWYWLVLPIELIYLWQRYAAKQICLREIDEVKSLYSSILFLMQKEG